MSVPSSRSGSAGVQAGADNHDPNVFDPKANPSREQTGEIIVSNIYGPSNLKGKSVIRDDKKPEVTNEYGLKIKSQNLGDETDDLKNG